jgi:hypothetical protein
MKKLMKKLFNFVTILVISLSLVSGQAFAGEALPAGTVLTEDSYVFSLEEAQELRQQIVALEEEVTSKDEIIFEYKRLDLNQLGQIEGLESLLDIRELQIVEYNRMHDVDLSRIHRLERQSKFAKAEKWAFLGIGISITVGSILIADKIDDSVESSPQLSAPASSSRVVPLFRF